jgi:hypothetical protein
MQVDIPMAPGLGLYLDEVFFENYNINQAKQAQLHNAKAKPLTDTETVVVDADTCADSIPNKIEKEKPLGDTENAAIGGDVCADSVPNDVTEGAALEVVDNEPVSTSCLFEQTNIFFK